MEALLRRKHTVFSIEPDKAPSTSVIPLLENSKPDCAVRIIPAALLPSSSGCQKFHHIHNWETSRGNQGLNIPRPWGATRNRVIRLSSFPHHQTFSSAALPMPLADDLLTPKERGMRDAKVPLKRLLHPSPPLKPLHFLESVTDPRRAGRRGGRSLASTECSKQSSLQTQRPKVCGRLATNGQGVETLAGHFLSLHTLPHLLRYPGLHEFLTFLHLPIYRNPGCLL